MTHLPNGMPIANIPEALRGRPQWVLWRLDPKENKPGDLTKVPYTDVNRKALANKPKMWLAFDVALARWAANPNGWHGIGYEFSADDPYTGIDFDNCIDPATGIVAPWADDELALLLPTYAEISPSGQGIKLWVETEQAHTLGSGDKAAGQIEVYSAGRFFAVTGRDFEDAQPAITKVDDDLVEHIIARENARRDVRKSRAAAPAPATHHNGNGATNGTYPPLEVPELVRIIDHLHPDRWTGYDDWLRIGMALHHWGGTDPHRIATAYALYDQYSKERAPASYGETPEKWKSFGKQNGHRPVTIGTLIDWAKEDAAPLDEPPHPAGDVGDDAPAEQLLIAPVSSFPELPEAATIDEAIGADACPWLDEYIAFSRRWSPQSYDGFHEACGLWLLSTVAARRVLLPFGGERFTNLYIALCARTSLWAKSTAAKIAKETISAAGLSQLLAPDTSTPQAFLLRLAERIPPGYGKESPDAQTVHRAGLAFAGQRGWWHEEFGSHLAGMMKDGGTMADFRGHLRILDDCPPDYGYDTVAHGLSIIKRPYLALLANLTPADLAPFARKGGALWGDGYFARFAFVTPPAGAERSREHFPDGWRAIPMVLSQPLRDWHTQLGIPEVELDEVRDEKGKATGEFRLVVTLVEPQRCTLGTGVFDAFYRYRETLIDLVDASDNHDLDGSYTRFAEKAMRVAMLLASVSNGGRIEINHWARGQQIAERWRRALHNLIEQLGQGDESIERAQEMKVLRLLERRGALPARDVARFANISTGEAQRILDQLVKAGELLVEPGKRTKRYRTVVSVAGVVVSYPAKSYDSSTETPKGVDEVSYKSENYDTTPYTTVTTPPEETPLSSGDDHHEELMEMWLGTGNVDAADSEAELIDDLNRKQVARKRVDDARAAVAGMSSDPSFRDIGRLNARARVRVSAAVGLPDDIEST